MRRPAPPAFPLPLLLLLLFAAAAPRGLAQELRRLTIYYSSSLNGNLDGCECRSNPRAGLAARAAWLNSLPPGERQRSLRVDAGDLLDPAPDPQLAEEILGAYGELGYEAIAVGEQELAEGVEALLARQGRFPLLAHNLTLCPDENRCLFFSPDPLLLERGGVRVGLLALVDPAVFTLSPPELRAKVKVQPPEAAARGLVARLREQGAELVVLLLWHGSLERAEALVREVGGIQVAVVGHEQRLVGPRRVGGTVLVSPGEEGNRVGVLRLSLERGGRLTYTHELRLFRYGADPADPGVRQRFERYRKQLRARLSGSPPAPLN